MIYQKQSNSLKLSNIKLNSFTFNLDLLLNIDIFYSIENLYIAGEMKFVDEPYVLEEEQFELNNSIMEISLKDIKGNEYSQKFYIYEYYQENASPGVNVIRCKFFDLNSFNLSKKFISKGFGRKKTSEIIKAILGIVNKDTEFKYSGTFKTYDKFVFPANLNVLKGLKTLADYENVYLFKTRDKIILNTPSNLITESKTHDYILNSPNQNYFYNIVSYRIKHTDIMKINTLAPNMRVFEVNSNSKSRKFLDINNTTEGLSFITGGTQNINMNLENKKLFYSFDKDSSLIYKNKFNSLIFNFSEIDILINGNFDLNTGDTIMITYDKEGPNSLGPNKKINGKWLVKSLTDKIVKNNYMQNVTLMRDGSA